MRADRPASGLRVLLTKRKDGGSVLRCVRPDGSETFQRQQGRLASFFPLHDLTHFAVESELGFGQGFFGLIADGWDVEDTTGKGSRGPLPKEAITVEGIVGSLDLERSGSVSWTAETFNEQAATFAETRGLEALRLTDAQLARVRNRTRALHQLWAGLAPGDTLEIEFRPSLG